MKKLTALLLMLTLLFCACNTNVSPSDNGTENRQYTIYTDTAWQNSNHSKQPIKENLQENISVDSVYKKDFSYTKRTYIENSTAPNERTLDIAGKSLSLTLDRSYTTSISTSPTGKEKSVGMYDNYVLESGEKNITIRFKQNSDTVVSYVLSGDERLAEGTFSEQQAKEKADALITELYGKETLSAYTHKETSVIDSQILQGFGVHYVKYVHGYISDEDIIITFNRQGKVVSINAMKLNLFDNAKNDITKAEIEAAEKALRESINDEWVLYDDSKSIVMDSTGQCFFKIYGSIKNDDDSFSSFYININ